MFEGFYSPPHYNDLYNFRDGPQDDIFEDSYLSLPIPSPDAPLPVLASPSTSRTGTNSSSAESLPEPPKKEKKW